jgi:hypothetical protein
LTKVGYPTLAHYLQAQPPRSSPKRLADELGHSVPWLQIRARRDGLEDLLEIGPRPRSEPPPRRPKPVSRTCPATCGTGTNTTRSAAWIYIWETGITPQRMAALLTQAGVRRRTDPAHFEQQALARAGWTGTLADYATNRAAAGWTIQRMSWELGRSDMWVARRFRAHGLGHLIQPPGRRKPSV